MSKRIGRGRRRTPKPRRASRPAGTAAPQLSREVTPSEAGSFRTPLAGPVDVSHLVRVVPQLAPETLHQLIRHCGLDVCAEIVASATPTQLASVLDLDLWRSAQPGHDERFDTERFGEWLELLVDAGDPVAARTFAAMDEHLVVAGLSRYVRVFDPAAIATTLDGEPPDIDVTSHRGPECEVGGYLVRGITAGAWDAIIALLLALDADHPERFHAVMRECRRLSNSTPEVDGLDCLLMEPEQLLYDVALDREHRRSRQGYSTPADARAFLLMARRRRRPSRGEPSVNPLVAAYFRAANDTIASGDDAGQDLPRRTLTPSATLTGVPEAPDAVVDMLDIFYGAGLVPQRPRALLEGTHAQPSRLARIRPLIEYVRDSDDTLYLARSHELAFLANTLVAGCSIQSRSFTPQEASDAAVGICNLGLEHWPARWPGSHATSEADLDVALPDTFLIDHDLVSAFEVGWAVLHEDVSMFVAEQLLVALSNLRCSDADIQEGLDTLRIELTKQREAGTPWHARNALDVIAMLDMPAWVSVLGLLDECPVIPAALTATLEGRTGAVSATAFEFISTCSQFGRVREFMARFLDILGR
jgi:Family of unknown function (DUF6178)